MIKVSRTQKIMARLVGVLAVVMLCFGVTSTVAHADGILNDVWTTGVNAVSSICRTVVGWVGGSAVEGGSGQAAEEEGVASAIGFEDIGRWSAAYLSTNMQPDEDGDVPGAKALNPNYQGDKDVDAGDAGVFVAYVGKSWISSLNTISSVGVSYSTYYKVPVSKNGNKTSNSIYQYCNYGYVLGQMGLDKSSSGSVSIGSKIQGYVVLGLYYAAIGVDALFYVVMKILKVLNPFMWFVKGVNTAVGNNAGSVKTPDGGTADWSLMQNYDTDPAFQKDGLAGLATGAFSGLQDFLGTWYAAIYDFSWAVLVPFFFAALLVSLILYRHTGKWKSKLKKYIIRVAFLVIGIPLLGGIYTAALDKMSNSLNPNTSPATKIVCSTFIDFEAWASRGRLSLYTRSTSGTTITTAMPLNIDIAASGMYEPTAVELINVRNRAYEINNTYAMPIDMGNPLFTSYDNSSGHAVENVLSTSNMDVSDKATGNCAAVINMLTRFSEGKYYTAAEFEGSAKSALSSWISSDEKGNCVLNQFQTICDVSSWWVTTDSDDDAFEDAIESHRKRFSSLKHFGDEQEKGGDLLIENKGSKSYYVNIYANGGIQYSDKKFTETSGSHVYPWFDVSYKTMPIPGYSAQTYTATVFSAKSETPSQAVEPGIHDNNSKPYGLSTCSMYNYLNTSFHDGMTLYSPSDTPTLWARENHRSVNIVGNGFVSFLMWLNCVTMLLCYAVIGYFYGFGMLLANIGRTFQVVKAVPFAMLGSLKSIAELITYTIVMILEIILTIFLYSFVAEIMFTIPDLITSPMAAALKISYGTQGKTAYSIIMPVTLIVLIIFYSWFMVKAIKMRKKFIKAMDEAAQEIVNKFIGVRGDALADGAPNSSANVNTKNSGGFGKGALVGAGAGLGGAALLGANGKKDAKTNADGVSGRDGSSGKNGKNGFTKNAEANKNPLLPTGAALGLASGAGFSVDADEDLRDRAVAGNLDGNLDGEYNENYGMLTDGKDVSGYDETGLPKGGYDAQGNALNEYGQPIDAEGKPLTDKSGRLVYSDANGNLVNQDGHIVDNYGNVVTDKHGKPIEANSRQANKMAEQAQKQVSANPQGPVNGRLPNGATPSGALPSGANLTQTAQQVGQAGLPSGQNGQVQANAPQVQAPRTVQQTGAPHKHPYNPAQSTQQVQSGVQQPKVQNVQQNAQHTVRSTPVTPTQVNRQAQNVQQQTAQSVPQSHQVAQQQAIRNAQQAPQQSQTRQPYNPAQQNRPQQTQQAPRSVSGGRVVSQNNTPRVSQPQMPQPRVSQPQAPRNVPQPQARPQNVPQPRVNAPQPKVQNVPQPQVPQPPTGGSGVRNAQPNPDKKGDDK